MESCYREAEEQSQALDDELSSVLSSREKLREQISKLGNYKWVWFNF